MRGVLEDCHMGQAERAGTKFGEVATDPESDATLLERGNCLNRIGICFDGVELGLQGGLKLNLPRC